MARRMFGVSLRGFPAARHTPTGCVVVSLWGFPAAASPLRRRVSLSRVIVICEFNGGNCLRYSFVFRATHGPFAQV
jgi:hypothetical protein